MSQINPRTLQVLTNFCGAAADAMAFTLMRTAHSAFVKETEDFSCQIVTRDGLAFANPRQFGAPWYSGIDYGPLLASFDDYAEGDICITNDPEAGHVATHTPDIHIWKPVYHEGTLACFVVGHIHNTDVGGAVPASLSRSLTESAQEGLRIPPVKLVQNGVENPYIAQLIRSNVRLPDQNLGDLAAQIASVNVGERKMGEIIRRFGLEQFLEGVEAILDHAETQTRAILSRIPDGDYFFADYADEDAPAGLPARVALTLRIKGDTVELDYTGSDPQLGSSLNMPTGGRERHPLVMVGLTYVLFTLDPTLWLNAGTLRPARAVLPEGSMVNSDRGAAIMNVKTSARNGRPIMASIGPVGGGGGATPFADGSDGAGGATGFLRNTPVEITETEVPIRFLRYGLQPDTGAPGLWRGGLSAVMEFQVSAPETVVTARNRNRSVMAAWGLQGAGAACVSRFVKNPDEVAVDLGNTDLVACAPGDVIRVVGPGAGGWGDPFQRPVERVLRDVRAGAVSMDSAAKDYGVVIRDGFVDAEATALLRKEPPAQGGNLQPLPQRQAFEVVWTPERYDLLTAFLARQPVGWRFFLKHRIFAEVAKRVPSHTQQDMAAIFDDLSAQYAL